MRKGRTATISRTAALAAHQRAHARRALRAKASGAALLLASMMLVVYAVPCFAASIWDEGLSPQRSETTFADPINDNAYQEQADGALVVEAAEEDASAEEGAVASAIRAASKVNASVTETTGPGIALDDDAVTAAKKRVQAVTAATAERDAVISTITAEKATQPDRTLEFMTGTFAFFIAILFGMLGIRSIVSARRMRALVASASYGHALKA